MEHQILRVDRACAAKHVWIRVVLRGVYSEGGLFQDRSDMYIRCMFTSMGFTSISMNRKLQDLEVELGSQAVWPITSLVSFIAALNKHNIHTTLWDGVYDKIMEKKYLNIGWQTLHSGAGEYWFTEAEV